MNEITSTHALAEDAWDGNSDEGLDVQSDIVATEGASGRGIEFHVSMRNYTQHDMEGLIVEAAARVIVGECGNNKLAKLVEERCLALTTKKVDAHLASVTDAIIDTPIIPKFQFSGKSDDKPVTMREFIGLTGQAYLTQRVDSNGKPSTDGYYSKPRMQYLIETAMQSRFDTEIKKATNTVIADVQKAISDHHKAFLESEKARLREGLSKVIK